MPTVVAVIPARLESTRFPGKVLADDTGWPLVRHVHERVQSATKVDHVVVATDSDRIAAVVEDFGGAVVRTGTHHVNGTSRVAEAASKLDADIVVNVQGDEPEIDPGSIDLVVQALLARPGIPVATLATPLREGEDPGDENLVKVLIDDEGNALDFVRSLHSGRTAEESPSTRILRHVGVYAFRVEFLATYASLEPTRPEVARRLEQLRILEHGYTIAVQEVMNAAPGIDTPEQYATFVRRRRSINS